MNISEYLSIEKCDCGRSGCIYFAGGVGDYGESFSQEEIEEMYKDAIKLVKLLEKYVPKSKESKNQEEAQKDF